MSAICGYAGPRADGQWGDDLLADLARSLAHRAELSAQRQVGRVGLAAPHDSIATSADGSTVCAFAGTLFNTAGSNEAQLVADSFAAGGQAALAGLDGSFSAALVQGDTLWLVRDALGEMPLYYLADANGVLFATEMKAFLQDPSFVARPDPRALVQLLTFSFIPGQGTMFDGACEVQPGHVVRLRDGEVDDVAYWDVREVIEDGDEASFVARVAHCAEDAVRRRLGDGGRVAAFLSGGIDSSAVIALLKKLDADVVALSASFGDEHPNELAYARMVARHCDVEHHIVDIAPRDFLDLLPRIIWALDDPLCDCITVPNYLLARAAAQQSSIVFNGEGGDPLFGGPKNKFMILGEWYDFLGNSDRTQRYLRSYHKFYDNLADACTPELLSTAGVPESLHEPVRPYLEAPAIDNLLNRLMRLNIKLKGGHNILVKVDKMLSAHGVRARSPLFDRTLTELSFRIPPQHKRRGDVEKYVFKKAVEPLLPAEVVYRKKAGMGVPLNQWFRATPLRDYAHDLLGAQRCRERGYFQQAFVDRLLRGDPPRRTIGKDRSGELLWMLLAVELWHRVFVDGDARP